VNGRVLRTREGGKEWCENCGHCKECCIKVACEKCKESESCCYYECEEKRYNGYCEECKIKCACEKL